MNQIKKIEKEIYPFKEELINHKLYKNINSIDNIKTFMQMHIFAVWDFMSLVKSLQNELSCTSIPWVPKGTKLSRRLINEIVMFEESDVNENKEPMSHFEMYLDAMKQSGADTSDIEKLIYSIKYNDDINHAYSLIELSQETKDFVDFTFEIINTKELHKIAAAFTFGRENLIPDMFLNIVKEFNKKNEENLNKFVYYLDRHIEIDSDEHGPMALSLIEDLCADDEKKWVDVLTVSKKALQCRIKLWDSINEEILSNNK